LDELGKEGLLCSTWGGKNPPKSSLGKGGLLCSTRVIRTHLNPPSLRAGQASISLSWTSSNFSCWTSLEREDFYAVLGVIRTHLNPPLEREDFYAVLG